MSASYILWRLLDGYGSDPEITEILDHTQIHIIPVVNVDGMFLLKFYIDDFPHTMFKLPGQT